MPLQEQECRLSPELTEFYSTIISAVRERFVDVPMDVVQEDGIGITVQDIHPNGRHRPFLRISQASVTESEDGAVVEDGEETVVVLLHVGVMRCDGCCCGILLDSKQFCIHPNDDVLLMCGLWEEGLRPMYMGKDRKEAVKYWLLDAEKYVDSLIDDAMEHSDSMVVLERYKKAVDALKAQFS